MKNKLRTSAVGLLAAAALLLGAKIASAAPVRDAVTVTITAVGKKETQPPTLKKDDVQLTVEKERKQIAAWVPGEKLYLAVLVDDSLDSAVASQWSELKEFFAAQPPTTYIAVAYARNGNATLVQDFTNDHALAAKALRIPAGGSALSSPYLALQDLMKRWPSNGDRRSVILVSSGIDYFRGRGFGPFSPDLDTTVERAQKGNINVWSLYAPGAGHTSRSFFRANNAQSNLSRLSDETGGEAYFLGTAAPVSFKAFLDEIQNHLNNQYLLTFAGTGGAKGKFARARLTTEISNVEFMMPSQVFLPPAK